MNKSMKSAQSGFTLIELIVVIVILGILAATALPKFANLGGDARLASLNAAKGALSSTAAMAHGKYMVNTGAPLPSVTVEGATISFATGVAGTGYPKANADLATAAGLNGGDYTVMVGSKSATGTNPEIPPNAIVIIPNSIAGATTAAKCFVMYKEPTAAGQAPVVTVGDGTTTVAASDCE